MSVTRYCIVARTHVSTPIHPTRVHRMCPAALADVIYMFGHHYFRQVQSYSYC